jgi:hypothetical protein
VGKEGDFDRGARRDAASEVKDAIAARKGSPETGRGRACRGENDEISLESPVTVEKNSARVSLAS